jgi:cobalamin biosynthesis protein CbiG
LNYFEALHDSVIDSLYGAKALPFKNLIKYIKSQLELNLGELNDCIEGVHSGHWRNASSVNLNGIVRQGLNAASLGSLAISELYSDIEAQDQDKLEQLGK